MNIKSLGSFQVELEIHREVRVTIPIHVVLPGGQPEPSADEGVLVIPPEEASAAGLVDAAVAEVMPASTVAPEPVAAPEPEPAPEATPEPEP